MVANPRIAIVSDRRLISAMLLMLAALVAGLMAWSGIGLNLERGLQSWRDGLRQHPASGRLVFVEIDARSLAALDHWPWPRHVYARAIDALGRAGAQAVAFDVDFSARSTPDNDAAFAKAIANAPMPVVLPTFRQAASQGGDAMVENLPIPELRRHAVLASVNIYADGDGLVRAYPYGVVTAGVARPSISAFLANSSGRSDAFFPIDGSIDPASIPRISFIDLIEDKVPAGSLAGRSVLIGASAIEMGDRYPMPGHGVIPGALIQLLAAETLRQRSIPTDNGPIVPILLLLCVAPFAGRARGRLRAAILAASGIGLLLLPLASEAARLGTFEIVPALVGLIVVAAALLMLSTIESLREARLTDAETGLPNRRALLRMLPRQGTVVALRIGNYNDVLGVLGLAGASELISRVVERLSLGSAIFRVEDAVLAWVDEHDDADRTTALIDAAAAMLRLPFTVAGRQLELVTGFGLADIARGAAIGRAILAAEHAVARGVRSERYDAAIADESDWRLSIATELDRAMAAGEIWNAYQPKVDLEKERIFAAEALVRWRHPTRGEIMPDSFIPALEDNGRIADLTLHVLELALRDRAGWAAQGFDVGVAVNISALLPAEPGFIDRLEAVLARHPGAKAWLTLEVTESAAMADPEVAIAALERLSSIGIKLSIDDYGTGQSTLSYLKRLPAREIKIDKGFVLGLETSRSDQAMVRSSIDLAHELGFSVVAEGVETEAAYALLKSFGCDAAQGWFVGRPADSASFLAKLGDWAGPAGEPERRIA
jgi:EAL domain-containing protein (putative c-di-GMP-specific phosphodiesterase class I)/CHASE2 domain-containing sensor protein